MHLKGVGIRKVSEFMNCSASLVVCWIRAFTNSLRERLSDVEGAFSGEQLPDIIEMDDLYTRVKKGDVGSRYGLLIHGGAVNSDLGISDLHFVASGKSETDMIESTNSSIRDNLTRFNRNSNRFSKCYNMLKDTLLLFFQR